MPETWGPLIEEHGLDPSNFGGIPGAPPAVVAAGLAPLGSNLTLVPHPVAGIARAVATNIGGGITIWILTTEDEDE